MANDKHIDNTRGYVLTGLIPKKDPNRHTYEKPEVTCLESSTGRRNNRNVVCGRDNHSFPGNGLVVDPAQSITSRFYKPHNSVLLKNDDIRDSYPVVCGLFSFVQ